MEPKTSFYADVLARLRALKHGELKAVSDESGVPESTIRKLFYGEVGDPRIQTVEALHNYFAARPPSLGAADLTTLPVTPSPTHGPVDRSHLPDEQEAPHA